MSLHKRLLILVTLIVIGVVTYLSQTLVLITISTPHNSQNGPLTITQLNPQGKRSGILQLGSLALIARDANRIEGTLGNWQTTADVTPLPWFGLKEIKLSIEMDRNVDKISGHSLGCTVYEASTKTHASYSCNSPSGLYVYKTSQKDGVPWKNESYMAFPPAYSVTRHNKGLLGISISSTPSIFYADVAAKNVSYLAPPPDFDADDLKSVGIVADTTTLSEHFLLIHQLKGLVYFATINPNGAVTYQKYTPDKKWLEDGSKIKCALKQTTAQCYIGVGTQSPDVHGEVDEQYHQGHNDGHLLKIQFGEGRISYTESIVSKDDPIDRIYIDEGGRLYTVVGTNLYSLDTSHLRTQRTLVAPDASSIAVGKALYFISNNRLYEYDAQTKMTYMRFYSKKLRLSTVTHTGSLVFINAYAEDSRDNKLHTYQLLSNQNITPDKRLVDILPIYPDANQSSIIDIDYYENTIHIVLPDYVTFNKSGKIVPNVRRFDEEKQVALNYLNGLIPSIDDYILTYSRAGDS